MLESVFLIKRTATSGPPPDFFLQQYLTILYMNLIESFSFFRKLEIKYLFKTPIPEHKTSQEVFQIFYKLKNSHQKSKQQLLMS